jgi:TIR domain
MKSVFVSCRKEDLKYAVALREALLPDRIDVMFDQGGLTGEDWDRWLMKTLESVDVFVALVSFGSSLLSQRLFYELGLAIGAKIRVVSVLIGVLDPRGSNRLPSLPQFQTTIDALRLDEKMAAEKVAAVIRDMVKPRGRESKPPRKR